VALVQLRLEAARFLFGHLKQHREGVKPGSMAERSKDAGNARGMGRCLARRRFRNRPAGCWRDLGRRQPSLVLSAAAAPA
jgi:hypothetical protein